MSSVEPIPGIQGGDPDYPPGYPNCEACGTVFDDAADAETHDCPAESWFASRRSGEHAALTSLRNLVTGSSLVVVFAVMLEVAGVDLPIPESVVYSVGGVLLALAVGLHLYDRVRNAKGALSENGQP